MTFEQAVVFPRKGAARGEVGVKPRTVSPRLAREQAMR